MQHHTSIFGISQFIQATANSFEGAVGILAITAVMAVVVGFNANLGGCVVRTKWNVLQLIGAKLGNTAIFKGLSLVAVANVCVGDAVTSCYAAEPFVGFKGFAKKHSIKEVCFNANRLEA